MVYTHYINSNKFPFHLNESLNAYAYAYAYA